MQIDTLSKLIVRMNEEGFTKEWCQIALTVFGLKTDSISKLYQGSAAPQVPNKKGAPNAQGRSAHPSKHDARSDIDIYLSMAIDEIDPANRFENLILLSLVSSNPFEMFESIIDASFINETGVAKKN